MSGFNLRMHRGGVYAWVKWIRTWITYAFFSGLILIPFSIFMQFDGEPLAKVVLQKPNPTVTAHVGYEILGSSKEILAFKSSGWLNQLVFGVVDDAYISLYNLIFYILVLWQLYLIFKKLELSKPFHPVIAKRLNYIGWILISKSMIILLRVWYMDKVIRSLTTQLYRLDHQNYLTHVNSFQMGILILIVGVIYKTGCDMQNEQDLTI